MVYRFTHKKIVIFHSFLYVYQRVTDLTDLTVNCDQTQYINEKIAAVGCPICLMMQRNHLETLPMSWANVLGPTSSFLER